MDNLERPKGGMFPLRTENRSSGTTVTPDAPSSPTRENSPAYKDAVREAFDNTAPAPTAKEVTAANAGKLAPRGISKTLIDLSKTLPIRLVLLVGAMGGLKVAADKINEGIHREASADFIKHLGSENTKTNPEEIFDTTATKGVKSERNTIWMTREEYDKIAPPEIDRTNAKEVPMTLNIHPQPDGRTTRDLTLEQGTAVNAMIYVKTPDGNIREVTYTKIPDPGGVTGASPVGFTFPNCQTLLGHEGEIQDGDIFPAPISGRVYYRGEKVDYYKGQKLEAGTITGDYLIEGEYRDSKTGKTFKTIVRVDIYDLKTKPLIPNLPNTMDPAFNIVDADGKVGYLPMNAKRDKMPIVTVQQGEDLFKFITKPDVQKYSSGSKIKSQVSVSTSYQGDFGENGIANTFAGENCTHPTVDNKAIVLK